VVWDGECGYFICHHKDCASSFPPPETDGAAEEAVKTLLEFGAVDQWLQALVKEDVPSMRLDDWHRDTD